MQGTQTMCFLVAGAWERPDRFAADAAALLSNRL